MLFVYYVGVVEVAVSWVELGGYGGVEGVRWLCHFEGMLMEGMERIWEEEDRERGGEDPIFG